MILSLENTVKESYFCGIKIEHVDFENSSGQNNDEGDTTWDLIKTEYNSECLSESIKYTPQSSNKRKPLFL